MLPGVLNCPDDVTTGTESVCKTDLEQRTPGELRSVEHHGQVVMGKANMRYVNVIAAGLSFSKFVIEHQSVCLLYYVHIHIRTDRCMIHLSHSHSDI